MPQVAEEARRAAGRTILIGLAAAFAALALFGFLANQVLRGGALAFDRYIGALVHSWSSPALTAAMRFFTDFGSPPGVAVLACGALIGLWLSGWRRGAVLFLITMAGAGVLDAVLKALFRRPRPEISLFGTPIPETYSFPSGHALLSACFFGVLASIAAARIHNLAARIAIWSVACSLILMVGLSRVYLGVHYASDVLAGYAAALVWVVAVSHVDRLMRRRANRRTPARK